MRNEIIRLRLTEAEKEVIRTNATRQGKTISDFLRTLGLTNGSATATAGNTNFMVE